MITSSISNSKRPSVSIVVITNNRLALLKETLASILSQTFTDFELIIVDNMSKDGTSDYVIGLSDPRVRYFRNSNYGIIAVNRNYGIQQACGKYIAFCDDDDLWLPEKLNLQVALLEKYLDVALCYTNAQSFIGDKIIAERMINRKVVRDHFYQLLRGNFIPNSSVLIRCNIFGTLGMLTENASLREDYEMCLRIASCSKLMGIDSPLIRYRIHSGNVAGNKSAETLRAIRTVRSIVDLINLPSYLVIPSIGFQYLKYLFYCIASR